MIKRIVTNFAALFTGEIVARVCHFIAVIYLARMLGVSGFGSISFSLALLSYFLLATNLGLGELGVREIARKKDVKDIVETIVSIRLTASAISFLALLVIACTLRKMPHTRYLLIAFGFTLFPYALSVEWVFRGIERMKYNAYGKIINAVLYAGLIIMFVRKPEDILKVAAITILADFISSIFYYVNFSRKFGQVKLHFDIKRWFSLLPTSLQLFVSSGLFIAYLNFGTVALGFAKNEQVVGIYGAAFKLILFCYALSDTLVAVTFPVISRLYHESREQLQEFINYCIKAAVLIGLPIAVGGLLLGPRLITLVYGVSYSKAGAPLQIMAWAVMLNLVDYILSYALVAFDRQSVYLRILMYATLLNVVFNVIAIPFIGYLAPSIALVLAEVVILALSIFFARDIVRLPLIKLAVKPCAAAFLMGLILLPLCGWLNPLALIVIGAAIYAGALLMAGVITKAEIARIRSVFT